MLQPEISLTHMSATLQLQRCPGAAPPAHLDALLHAGSAAILTGAVARLQGRGCREGLLKSPEVAATLPAPCFGGCG